MNLSSSAFLDETQNTYAKKVIAETYMQLYQYAAEDFTTIPDIQKFITQLTSWMVSVDEKLALLMEMIANHTHAIPPHAHSMQGAQPIPLMTNVPINKSGIKWTSSPYPVLLNTTGTIPNLLGNRITVSAASEGSVFPTIRRTLPIPITMMPLLSPNMQDFLNPKVVV